MLLNPAVLALLLSSAVVCALTALASAAGLLVAAGWRPEAHGERQLARERRALLVESSLKLVLCCELTTLFLFVATVDRLHPLLPGAMCAAGSLNASRFGYPALGARLLAFLLCGLWLVVNRASLGATASVVVRVKQLGVSVVLGALLVENVLQWRYFLDLDPAVITSCCATIFAERSVGLGSEMASLSVGLSRAAFFAGLLLTMAAGALVLLRNRVTGLFSVLAVCLGALALPALVSWVAPSYYELPTHHCPFCLLSARAGHVGYLLLAALALAVVTGAGAGLVARLRALDPLRSIRLGEERRLCAVSMGCYALFALVAAWPTLTSGIHLEGY